MHKVSNILAVFALLIGGFLALQAPALYAASQQLVPADASHASLNWSGYVSDDRGSAYTSVTGSWIVPTVSSDTVGKADATWVGIGGTRSQDLIQAGTQAIVGRDGTVTYQAWYETLPDVSTPVRLAVKPGDSITTTISQQESGLWHIVIHNNTTGKQYDQLARYHSSLSSAEWVQERVSGLSGAFYPLDDFGSVTFTDASAIKDGQVLPLSKLDAHPLVMINGAGTVLASASALKDDGSFTVERESGTTPVAPAPVAVAQPEPQAVSISPDSSVIVITFGPSGVSVSEPTTQSADTGTMSMPHRYRSYHRVYQLSLPLW